MPIRSLPELAPWASPFPAPLTPLLTGTRADVAVVGAGVTGLTVAYELCLRGHSVVVLDAGPIGRGETSHTSAHLVTALDERYFEIERLQGADGAAAAYRSHAAAIDRIETIVRTESIDCDFRRVDGYLHLPLERAPETALLERELLASRRAGANPVPLHITPGLAPQLPCLRFPAQAQLHPMRYLDGLARAIRRRGGRIFTGTRVESVSAGPPPEITTDDRLRVVAGDVVLATNTLLASPDPEVPAQTAIRSFLIALAIPPDVLEPALYWDGFWDNDVPYHYVRLATIGPGRDHTLLIVGGEDERLDQAGPDAAAHLRLLQWTREHFPAAGRPAFRWHGRILETEDEFACIGPHPDGDPHIYVARGDSGNGMTYAAIAGMILPDLVEGRSHPWASFYSPRRSIVRARPRRMVPARTE